MIHFKPGSHAYNIIDILSVTGELPMSALNILGSAQTYENVIRRMLIPQKIVGDKKELTGRLLNISGMNGRRRIRLAYEALPLLNWIGAENYYDKNYMKSNRSSGVEHVTRSARFAECVAMFMAAGYEFRPHKLPVLQAKEYKPILDDAPVFYSAKMIKTFNSSDVKKTGFTRMTGALLANKRAYVVYNTRNELLKGFEGGSEIKSYIMVGNIAELNAGYEYSSCPAIMFGKSNEIAVTMLKEFNKLRSKRKKAKLYCTAYGKVHFITLDKFGVRQLRLMKYPDWEERLIDILFEEETLSHGLGQFVYDATINGSHYFSFLNGDIYRLYHFSQGVKGREEQCNIICFPHQLDLIKGYFGDKIKAHTVELDDVEKAIQD